MDQPRSHQDILNGRRLTHFLFALIFLKEIAVIVGLTSGNIAAGTTLPPGTLTFVPTESVRAGVAFGFSLVLMAFAYRGYSWARVVLGLNYLFLSGWTGAIALLASDAFETEASRLALGNAGLGLVIGLTLLFAPSLGAFAWYQQMSRRHALPVPLDDQPTRRTLRRERTLAEAFFALMRKIATLMMILLVVAILTLIYGFGGAVLEWLRP
jgi:hypothetical protein